MHQLKMLLRDEAHMQQIRDSVWNQRHLFTFDYHVDGLTDFFYKVIQNKSAQLRKNNTVPSIAALKPEP
jgi:hypothetical protein